MEKKDFHGAGNACDVFIEPVTWMSDMILTIEGKVSNYSWILSIMFFLCNKFKLSLPLVWGTIWLGTVENHGKKMAKIMADFCENRKNHGINTAKTWHQITGPKTIIQSVKFNIQYCRPSLHTVQGFHQ